MHGMPTELEFGLHLLSSAPWFDEATAIDLLTLSPKGHQPAALDDAANVLRRIDSSGVLISNGSVKRVTEPLRSEMRRSIFRDDENLYLRALSVFSKHAVDTLLPKLKSVMGEFGGALNVTALRAIANPQESSTFDSLVDLVQKSKDSTEARTALAAADIYEAYSFRRDHRTAFLYGLSLWAQNRRIEAEIEFTTVIESDVFDKAWAISAHLIGVMRHSQGNLPEAQSLLDRSVQVLRSIGDDVGLALVLTTLGRNLRDSYREFGVTENLEAAILVLEEATRLNEQNNRIDAHALIALSQCYVLADRPDDALETAQSAVNTVGRDTEGVEVRSNLALIMRDIGQTELMRQSLDDAARIAERDNVQDLPLARLLNMLAASERRSGQLLDARKHARESLAMGRRMNDQRHIAHSAHTLASIYLDLLPVMEDERISLIREARLLLFESQEILFRLRNQRGVDLVADTLERVFSEEERFEVELSNRAIDETEEWL